MLSHKEGHLYMPSIFYILCSHNCNCSQSAVNSQGEFLTVGQQYHKIVALSVKNVTLPELFFAYMPV